MDGKRGYAVGGSRVSRKLTMSWVGCLHSRDLASPKPESSSGAESQACADLMANILILDDNEVAVRAMRGILNRSRHRCVVASTPEEAFQQLSSVVVIDLAIVELRLKGSEGSRFLARVRTDPIFKQLPMVVYTLVQDHSQAGRLRMYGLQNYFIKPYHEEVIHAEIARAKTLAWRDLHFEEDRSFCAQMGLSAEGLRKLREAAGQEAKVLAAMIESTPKEPEPRARLRSFIGALIESSQAAGFWAQAEYLGGLDEALASDQWEALTAAPVMLATLGRLLDARLRPDHVPEALITDAERDEMLAAAERKRWMETDVDRMGQLMSSAQMFERVDSLQACPVVDSVGAEFVMACETKSQTLQLPMELAAKDPGLAASVMVAVNKLGQHATDRIEDPAVAVGVLGSTAVAALARALPLVKEQELNCPPISWPQFWMFQRGVAAVALHTARQMEFEVIQEYAFTAGLLHDIGKLILARVAPFAFHAMVMHSRRRGQSLHASERAYIGCSSRDLAVRFCEKHLISQHFINVIRWVETPEEATEDQELVAVVALARTLCMHHHVGYCGDTPKDHCPPVEETPAWAVLKSRVYPSFSIQHFDREIHPYCQQLKQELLGRLPT